MKTEPLCKRRFQWPFSSHTFTRAEKKTTKFRHTKQKFGAPKIRPILVKFLQFSPIAAIFTIFTHFTEFPAFQRNLEKFHDFHVLLWIFTISDTDPWSTGNCTKRIYTNVSCNPKRAHIFLGLILVKLLQVPPIAAIFTIFTHFIKFLAISAEVMEISRFPQVFHGFS